MAKTSILKFYKDLISIGNGKFNDDLSEQKISDIALWIMALPQVNVASTKEIEIIKLWLLGIAIILALLHLII